MRYLVAVEDMEPDYFVCWALDAPGCFSRGRTREEAMASAPAAISAYHAWCARHGDVSRYAGDPIEIELVESFNSFPCSNDPEYLVNAFFEDDLRPLAESEVDGALRLLEWSRRDLLDVVARLSSEDLERPIPGEIRKTIGGILQHVAGAENWYFSQLSLGIEWASLSEDVFGKLDGVRANSRSWLLTLIGDHRVTESCEERWSARKILRRTLWHERAHTGQIVRLRGEWEGLPGS